MKRPDKTSQVYDHHAAAQMGMASRDYTKDLEAYCEWLEKRVEELIIEYNCYSKYVGEVLKEFNDV